ncbi:MAG TPA: DUF5719 family protein [Aquiluna sp.]
MKIFLRALTALLVLGLSGAHWQLFPQFGQLETKASELQAVSVEPLPLKIVCPGALAEVGGESGVELGTVEKVGEALISSQLSAREILVAPPVTSQLAALTEVGDKEQSTNAASMIQTQVIDRERARGLAGMFCQAPIASGWLINGSAVVGFESVIIAHNPAEVEALIELEIHLPSRIITDRFALAPGEEKLITTSQYANGEEAFAVYFESSGPKISMAMQNRQTRGLNPIGVELEGPTLRPDTDFVFAGLRPLTEGFQNPTMRVYNPGEEIAEVVVTVFGEDNVELFRELVNPSGFSEIELQISGTYQLATLTSSTEVLAAILNPSIEPVLDFAWIQPAELFTSVTLPLSSYQNSVLIANPSSSVLEVSVETRTGDRLSYQTLVIAPFGQVALPASANSIKIDGSIEFAVALEVLDPNGYSVIHPRETTNLGNNLEIRVN